MVNVLADLGHELEVRGMSYMKDNGLTRRERKLFDVLGKTAARSYNYTYRSPEWHVVQAEIHEAAAAVVAELRKSKAVKRKTRKHRKMERVRESARPVTIRQEMVLRPSHRALRMSRREKAIRFPGVKLREAHPASWFWHEYNTMTHFELARA